MTTGRPINLSKIASGGVIDCDQEKFSFGKFKVLDELLCVCLVFAEGEKIGDVRGKDENFGGLDDVEAEMLGPKRDEGVI